MMACMPRRRPLAEHLAAKGYPVSEPGQEVVMVEQSGMKARAPVKKGSREMFYLDAQGERQDRDLHAAILGDDTADLTEIRAARLAEGWSQQEIDALWPLPVKAPPAA